MHTYVYRVSLVPSSRASAAALDGLEEAQAVAGTEQELFPGLCSPRHGREGERNRIGTLHGKTAPATHRCRWFFSEPWQPLPGWVALPPRRAYTRLPLRKTGTCGSLIVLGNKGLGCGGRAGKTSHCIAGGISSDVVGHQH